MCIEYCFNLIRGLQTQVLSMHVVLNTWRENFIAHKSSIRLKHDYF